MACTADQLGLLAEMLVTACTPSDSDSRDESLDRLTTTAIYYWAYHKSLEAATTLGYKFQRDTNDGSHIQLWRFFEDKGLTQITLSGNKIRTARTTAAYKLRNRLVMTVDECIEEARFLVQELKPAEAKP